MELKKIIIKICCVVTAVATCSCCSYSSTYSIGENASPIPPIDSIMNVLQKCERSEDKYHAITDYLSQLELELLDSVRFHHLFGASRRQTCDYVETNQYYVVGRRANMKRKLGHGVACFDFGIVYINADIGCDSLRIYFPNNKEKQLFINQALSFGFEEMEYKNYYIFYKNQGYYISYRLRIKEKDNNCVTLILPEEL